MSGLSLFSVARDLTRRRRRVDEAVLQVRRDRADFRHSLGRFMRERVASPSGLLACAGAGLAVGLLRRPRKAAKERNAESKTRTRTLRLLASGGIWGAQLVHALIRDHHGRERREPGAAAHGRERREPRAAALASSD